MTRPSREVDHFRHGTPPETRSSASLYAAEHNHVSARYFPTRFLAASSRLVGCKRTSVSPLVRLTLCDQQILPSRHASQNSSAITTSASTAIAPTTQPISEISSGSCGCSFTTPTVSQASTSRPFALRRSGPPRAACNRTGKDASRQDRAQSAARQRHRSPSPSLPHAPVAAAASDAPASRTRTHGRLTR
jgi:hypothetical protein